MKAERRPPKLDDHKAEAAAAANKPLTLKAQLVKSHVAGNHQSLGRIEVLDTVRRVVAGEHRALLGLDKFVSLGYDETVDAMADVWGWNANSDASTIDAAKTIASMEAAVARILEVSAAGQKIAFATSRPASLLPMIQQLVMMAYEAGAEIISSNESGEFSADGRTGRRIRWFGGVGVLTDGGSLLSTNGIEAGNEFLFHLPRPKLVIADNGFAGTALKEGMEVICFADLDALALGIAKTHEERITVVPLDADCAPAKYEPLLDHAVAAAMK